MESQIVFFIGTITSIVISIIILFQFIETRNERIYKEKYIYIVTKIAVGLIIQGINLLNQPIFNLASWMILLSIVSLKLYDNVGKKNIQRILEVVVLIIIFSVCETFGVVALDFIINKFGIYNIDSMLVNSLEVTSSKFAVLFLYYFILTRLWSKNRETTMSVKEYLVPIVIVIYSIVNLLVILSVISNITSHSEEILLLINMGCILFADFYLLYYEKCIQENSQLKLKLKLLEQQSILQYEYYATQEEKYNESYKILHDVNKHIRLIEAMYQAKDETVVTYTNQISEMLQPLALVEYSNNPILNIILNDKMKYAVRHNIKFELDVRRIDLSFMEAIEVTTVFGNLLDNAVEACEQVKTEKFIKMIINQYNDFIALRISNSTLPINKWSRGLPVSKKGKKHGIGLLNVQAIISKYDGNVVFEEENGVFNCNIIFNK